MYTSHWIHVLIAVVLECSVCCIYVWAKLVCGKAGVNLAASWCHSFVVEIVTHFCVFDFLPHMKIKRSVLSAPILPEFPPAETCFYFLTCRWEVCTNTIVLVQTIVSLLLLLMLLCCLFVCALNLVIIHILYSLVSIGVIMTISSPVKCMYMYVRCSVLMVTCCLPVCFVCKLPTNLSRLDKGRTVLSLPGVRRYSMWQYGGRLHLSSSFSLSHLQHKGRAWHAS